MREFLRRTHLWRFEEEERESFERAREERDMGSYIRKLGWKTARRASLRVNIIHRVSTKGPFKGGWAWFKSNVE